MKLLVVGSKARVEKYLPDLPITREVETVVVEATTIPAPDEAEEGAKPDLCTSLELMVAQKGRASTGWALIKMGFKVLFGKKLDR